MSPSYHSKLTTLANRVVVQSEGSGMVGSSYSAFVLLVVNAEFVKNIKCRKCGGEYFGLVYFAECGICQGIKCGIVDAEWENAEQ